MAKTRHLFFELLRRSGNALFRFFSRCEERGIMPRAARWIKVSVLSAFIAGISALSAASMLNCIITCYLPIDTAPYIENAEVTPNPTAGADSVTVKATAEIHEDRDVADTVFISQARSIMKGDTTEMQATDGTFDEKTEEFQARLYVGDLEPGEVGIQIEVFNNIDEIDGKTLDLEITETQ